MTTAGLIVRLEAKPGKEDELLAAPPAVEQVEVLADVLPG